MNAQTFDSRSGCVDYGESYEFLLAAYYSLSLSISEKVADFKISTNNEDMGDFDDVVLEITYNNGEHILYALQLKHSAKSKQIPNDAFTDPKKGDFCLNKYCAGFLKTKKCCEGSSKYNIPFSKFRFIIYTNKKMPRFYRFDENHKKVDTCEFTLKKINVVVHQYDKCFAEGLLDLSECDKGFIYTFENNEKGKLDVNFLKQVALYTKQKDAQEVERLISKIILSIFKQCDSSVVTNYINFFKYWWRGDYGTEKLSIKLTKRDVMTKLAEYILIPHIPNVDFGKITHYGKNSQKLNECFENFDISVVGRSGNKTEEIIWGSILEQHFTDKKNLFWLQPLCDHNMFLEGTKLPISSQGENFFEQTPKKIYMILWHMDRVPLFVKVGEASRKDIYAAVKLCQNNDKKKKFILLDDEFKDDEFSDDLKIFKNLTDLTIHSELCWEILENLLISIQGRRAMSLAELVNFSSQFYEILGVKELAHMLNREFVIGNNHNSDFLEEYVTRKIPKILLAFKAVEEIKDDIFVISCQGTKDMYFKRKKYEINRYILMEKSVCDVSEKFIILEGNMCTSQQFQEICSLNKNRNCHHVKIFNKDRIEWLETKGSVSFLKSYLLASESHVDDFESVEYFENKINLLCADPGMGKSMVLKYLRNRCPPNLWVILVNLNDHVNFFKSQHDTQELLNYFFENESEDVFVRQVQNVFAIEKKILFLWDGFDELPKKCVEYVILAIKIVNAEGYFQWVASRTNSREFLENTFGTFSLTLTPFTEQDQQNYINNSLRKKYSEEDRLEEMIGKLNELMYSSLRCGYFDYTGNPLQIYMLMEIFLKNPDKYSKELKIFILTDIYHEFMEGKFEELFQLGNANMNNFLMKEIQRKFKQTQKSQYEIVALKASFEENIFSSLNVDCTNFLQTILDNRDSLGLIFGLNDDKKPIFAHKTFEEYLTASWLAKNWRNFPDFTKILFQEDYKNIRFMFDMILAKNSPVHIAVLYRNLDILEKSVDEISKRVDDGGRNPLHIACSWGLTHPRVKTTEDNGIIFISTNEDFDTKNDTNTEIVKFLLTHNCDPFQKDNLTKWNSVDYADKTSSIASLEMILTFNHRIDLHQLENFDIYTFLYYCIKFNYRNVFLNLGNYPYIEIKEGDDSRTLLQFAVHMDRKDFVEKLLSFLHYQQVVNKPYKDIGGPFFSAASNGNLDIFKMLQNSGAKLGQHQLSPLLAAVALGFEDFCVKLLEEEGMDPNECSADGNSFLQVAALRNRCGIMNLLLLKGAEINTVNCFDMTALDYCVDSQSVEGVELLLSHGADVNRQSKKLYGYTPLHGACEKGTLEIVKLLIEAGADPAIKSNQLYTPLHVALINKQEKIAKYLIEVDSSVINEYSKEKSTPVMLATLENFYNIVELLAKLGADLDSTDSLDSPLRIASLKNFDKCVEILLKYGASPNKVDTHGFTPLFYCIRNTKIMKLLLDNPTTEVNVKSDLLVTPLHFAAENGEVYAVEELIKHGADLNATERNNETPLFYAITYKHDKVVKCLLKQGAKLDDGFSLLRFACVKDTPDYLLTLLTVIDCNTRDDLGRTVLHYAAMHSLYCVKILLKKGIDVNVCDRNNCSSLVFAILGRKIDILMELLKNEADVNRGFGSSTALHLAAGLGDVAALVLLVNSGCDINAIDENKRTTLHCVVEQFPGQFFGVVKTSKSDYKSCARELLTRGAIITMRNNLGWSPVLSAVYHNNFEIIDFFVRELVKNTDNLDEEWQRCFSGAAAKNHHRILQLLHENDLGNVNNEDPATKMTPLCFACFGNAYDSADYLLTNGAEVNKASTGGCTPLCIACAKGHFNLVKLLIQFDADIDIPNDHGNTPLFTAAAEGFTEIVYFLCERGAAIDVVDADGDTPLHDAAARGHLEIVEYLVSKGAVSSENENGLKPIDLAKSNKHEEIVKFLAQCDKTDLVPNMKKC